jgi:hypothetical protein
MRAGPWQRLLRQHDLRRGHATTGITLLVGREGQRTRGRVGPGSRRRCTSRLRQSKKALRSRRLRWSAFVREDDSLRSAMQPQLAEQLRDMRLDGAFAEVEVCGELSIALAGGKQTQHVEQAFQRAGRGRRVLRSCLSWYASTLCLSAKYEGRAIRTVRRDPAWRRAGSSLRIAAVESALRLQEKSFWRHCVSRTYRASTPARRSAERGVCAIALSPRRGEFLRAGGELSARDGRPGSRGAGDRGPAGTALCARRTAL